jgi:hypothetical protein
LIDEEDEEEAATSALAYVVSFILNKFLAASLKEGLKYHFAIVGLFKLPTQASKQ